MKNIPKNEEKILDFWKKNKTFEKSVKARPKSRPYVFYDGPPFATGLPHYGHIVASLMKDIVPRYWTMKGFRVERKWGWDCHGLPIENIIEKRLNLKSRKDIEHYGIEKFNKACHSAVLKYAKEWEKTVERIGRWVDMENDYKTMDIEYMESVWWVFSELYKSGLIYQGHKAMHICPRCETPLSNFEVTQGYKDVKDLSATAKFKLKNPKKLGLKDKDDVYILAWTTTPWTLPGNVLLAVGRSIEYVVVKLKNQKKYPDGTYIMSKDYYEKVMSAIQEHEIGEAITTFNTLKNLKGADLVGLAYEPLFPYFEDTKNAFRIVSAKFVATEEGTGIVHIAPAFGEDDYELGKREDVGWVQHVGMDGRFTKDVKDFAKMEVKPKENPQSTDLEIIKWLAKENKLFDKEKYPHNYPHCWRCDSPLINYATSSWFVGVTKLKNDLLKNNKKIHWVPEHIKEGRFGKWLEGARDWAMSRNRFWGAPIPIWQSEDGDTICIGSVSELEKLSNKKIKDIHKHIVDKIIIEKNGKKYKRISEVFDCWFESGSMPYGQMHYPFENKAKFEKGFPAEFIAEGQDQTRGWFYTLHILATALTKYKSIPTKQSEPAFKNVIVNGIVLAEDGKKMSKRFQNYPDPMEVISKYGADAMRYYLASSAVMHAESLNFSERDVREMYNKVIGTLTNVLELYLLNKKTSASNKPSKNVLDKWIIAKTKLLIQETTEKMNQYKLAEASRPILDFITELSQWYVRRSRARIKSQDIEALSTLNYVLSSLSLVCAPFTPFVAEQIHQKLKNKSAKESVHLENWPKSEKLKKEEEKLLSDMAIAREIVERALALRSEAGIKVRQPLNELKITNYKLSDDFLNIIAEEINVKNVRQSKGSAKKISLNTKITPELKKEGQVREIIRAINALRKMANLTPQDKVIINIDTISESIKKLLELNKQTIAKATSSKDISFGKKNVKNSQNIKLDDDEVWIGI